MAHKDQVTNLTHKISGATFSSITYERPTGGEATKIAREDLTYIEWKYDGGLRLTNELHKDSGGSLLAEYDYAFDDNNQSHLFLTSWALSGIRMPSGRF